MYQIIAQLSLEMLKIPSEWLKLLVELVTNLASETGAEWHEELKRFLKKEPCWVKTRRILPCDACRAPAKLVFEVAKNASGSAVIMRTCFTHLPLTLEQVRLCELYHPHFVRVANLGKEGDLRLQKILL